MEETRKEEVMTGTDEMARSEQELGGMAQGDGQRERGGFRTWLPAWWRGWKERRRCRMEERRMERCRRKAERMVQLMEYGGDVYVSFGGRPVVPGDNVCGDICETVDESRRAYASYLYDHGLDM